MAYKNKVITNSKTGQTVKFIQTGKETDGQLLEMESTFSAMSTEPPPHYHPFQVEDFEVISGELTVRIDGALKILKQSDTLHIPVNKVHSMWNNTTSKAVIRWKVQPAMDTEFLLETATGLANEGKTNSKGIPNPLYAVLFANKYSRVFRLARPPFYVQRILFSIITPLLYLLGYRISYEKYFN